VRSELIAAIADRLTADVTRVGIDGRSAAGKTTFADELADAIRRPVIRASLDDFHTPGHKFRSMAEEYTAESYYDEAFDYVCFREWVVEPLMPGGSRHCRLRYWDSYHDVAYDDEPVVVPADAVLVVDGGMLMRPELADAWDMTIWIDVDWDDMVERAVARDVAWVGDADVVRRRYANRFRPMHDMYERVTNARARATVVVDNRDPERPRLLRS
jgi:uridine kinase